MHPNLDRTLGELWGTRGSILLWSSTKNQSLLMAIDFNLVQQLWKFNWFPCLAFGYGLQKFIWPFVFFLRSLMPKNSSGMQKSYLLNISGPNIPSHFTVCIIWFFPHVDIRKLNLHFQLSKYVVDYFFGVENSVPRYQDHFQDAYHSYTKKFCMAS